VKRALAAVLAGMFAASLVACSPEATRTRNGGPGADVGNYSRNLPQPSTPPPLPG
jgi:curli biogenesis system outer membrane secretion channel CsgG